MNQLPSQFDVALIDDDSTLPGDALSALRELAFRKAAEDREWFLRNFWHVMNPKTFRWEKFGLRPYQKVEVDRWNRFMGVERSRQMRLKARQIGWTTTANSLAFHDAFFNDNHPWLMASQGESEAVDTLNTKIKFPYNMMPVWMREPVRVV